jgi:BAI1-associated protein 3
LLHDLEESKSLQYCFDGDFSSGVQHLLTQHATRSSLSETESAFIHWLVFAEVHTDYRLSFAVFEGLLKRIINPIQSGCFTEENLKLFWESALNILLTGLGWMHHMRKKINNNKIYILSTLLSFMSKMSVLQPPLEAKWFPTDLYEYCIGKN